MIHRIQLIYSQLNALLSLSYFTLKYYFSCYSSAVATSTSIVELPAPDYIDSPEDDPTLRVPVIIQYDDWRGGITADTGHGNSARQLLLIVHTNSILHEPFSANCYTDISTATFDLLSYAYTVCLQVACNLCKAEQQSYFRDWP